MQTIPFAKGICIYSFVMYEIKTWHQSTIFSIFITKIPWAPSFFKSLTISQNCFSSNTVWILHHWSSARGMMVGLLAHSGSISKIDQILSWQQTPQGLHRRQSAQPGIKYPDRTVIHTARLLFSRVFVQKVYYTIAASAAQGQKRRFSQLKFAGRRFFRFWRQIFGFLPAFSGSIFRWVLL